MRYHKRNYKNSLSCCGAVIAYQKVFFESFLWFLGRTSEVSVIHTEKKKKKLLVTRLSETGDVGPGMQETRLGVTNFNI